MRQSEQGAIGSNAPSKNNTSAQLYSVRLKNWHTFVPKRVPTIPEVGSIHQRKPICFRHKTVVAWPPSVSITYRTQWTFVLMDKAETLADSLTLPKLILQCAHSRFCFGHATDANKFRA